MTTRRPLYLHIGLHKTGTTSIQRLLADGEAEFAQAGYHVADRLGRNEPGHHRQVVLLETEGAEAFVRSLDATPGDAVLVSCERLSKMFRDASLCQEVLTALSRSFDVTVIAFLRRQDFLKESVYAQVVKARYSPDIMEEVRYQYDIGRLVRNLEAAIGSGRISLAVYRDDLGGRGDLSGDFLRKIGWTAGAETLPKLPRDNTSLHRRARLFLGQIEKPSRSFAKSLVAAVMESGAIANDGQPELMSPATRATFLTPYLAENTAVAEAYALEGGGFFGSVPDLAQPWFPPEPIRRAELAAIEDRLGQPVEHALVFAD